MDAQCALLDATEIHFVIDNITDACLRESSNVSMQTWLLNQRLQEVLLNGVSVEDASLDGLVPKELLQRLVDASKATIGRISAGFSASIKSLNSVQGIAEEDQAPPIETQSNDEEPAASEPRRRCPVQEKLETEVAAYNAEIETLSKTSCSEDVSRVVELRKLRSASEDKLKKLRAGYKACLRWREANKWRKPPTRGVGHPSLRPSANNADEGVQGAPPEKTNKKYKKYELRDKLRALDMLAKGMKPSKVAKRFRTHDELIRYWRKREAPLRKKMEESGGDNVKRSSSGGCRVLNQERHDDTAPVTVSHSLTSANPEKHHRCGKCGEQFKMGIALRMHQRRRHGLTVDRCFACDACNEVFASKAYLTRHKRTHSGAKPFECESCHKRFTRSEHLRVHQLSHSGAKPFECETCHKGFIRKDKLLLHQQVHSLERPYECAECGYRYAAKHALKTHRKIHRAV